MSDARHWLTPVLGLGAVLVTTAACRIIDDPNHCANMDDDPCASDRVCDACTPSSQAPNGCVLAGLERDLDLAAPGCQEQGDDAATETTTTPPETDTSTTDTPVTTTIDLDTTSTEGETETDSTTGPPPMCTDDDGTYMMEPCGGATPFCFEGMCTGCDNSNEVISCANADGAPGTVCAGGRCVQCTPEEDAACSGNTPICDPETNQCVPCTEHAQCGAAACNFFVGRCVEGEVVTAGPGQTHPTLAAAVAALGPAGGTVLVAQSTYDETVTISSGTVVAFLPSGGATPEWQRTLGVGAPQLRVTGGATVLVDGIDFIGNDSAVDPALRVDDASLWVDRSRIALNLGVSLRAELNAVVMLRNCFVGGANDLPAVNAVTGSDVTLQYSTVGANLGASNAILCDAGTPVIVRDSIILTRGTEPEVVCAMLDAEHTAANTMLPGAGNMAVGATNTAWFTSYNNGDFHLAGDGLTTFADRAEWNVGDPSVDIDGEERAGVEGDLEHAGADVIP